MGRNLLDQFIKEELEKKPEVWECRQCGYAPNSGDNCVSCGRDYIGRPGPRPPQSEIPPRPQVKEV